MKAFIVFEKANSDKVILFARTRNEARHNAMFTSKLSNSSYINVTALRIKELDSFYPQYVFEIDIEDPAVKEILMNSKKWSKLS